MKLNTHSFFNIAILTAACLCSLLCQSVSAKKPLKVYILAGQSNMQGHADISTMDVIGLDPNGTDLSVFSVL